MSLHDQVVGLVDTFFGDAPTELHFLHLLREPYLSFAVGHVYAMAELAGLDASTPEMERLCAAYCFLACQYILVDNVLDGQVDAESTLLQIGQLITLFLCIVETEVCDRLPVEARVPVRRRILRRLVQRDQALRQEIELREGWDLSETDYDDAVGRSSLSLLFYEVLCGLKGIEPNDDALHTLAEFLYAMQMSDDMLDWRKDLSGDNHTPFLRRAAAKIGSSAPSEAELEQEIYLGGYFEESTAALILRLEAIEKSFQQLGSKASALYARQACDKITVNLRDVVDTKAKYLKTVAPRP